MDEITQQNAALAEQASASSEASLHRATEMNGMVSFFKVNSSFSSAETSHQSSVVSMPKAVEKPAAPAPAAQYSSKTSGGPQASLDDDEWEEF